MSLVDKGTGDAIVKWWPIILVGITVTVAAGVAHYRVGAAEKAIEANKNRIDGVELSMNALQLDMLHEFGRVQNQLTTQGGDIKLILNLLQDRGRGAGSNGFE